jgi:hypothetical protein
MTAFKAGRGGYRIGGTVNDRCTQVLKDGIPKPALLGWAKKFTTLAAIIDHHTIGDMLDGCELVSDPATLHARIKQAKDEIKQRKKNGDPDPHPDEGLVRVYNHLWNAPDRMRDHAADRGTLIHAIAEAHIEGRPLPDFTDEELPYALAFEAFLTEWEPEFIEVETTVYDPDLCVAGTFDALAVIEGEHFVLDWKSSKDIYPEVALQLAFYMHAPTIVRADGTTEPFNHPRDRAGAVHLRPDGTFDLIPMGDQPEDYTGFLSALNVARWAKSVDGWQPTPAVRERKAAA